MKYSNEVKINLPINKVIELFDNSDNMKHWQQGLLNFESIEGEPGTEGAKSRLRYKTGRREFEMIETIDKIDFPHEFHGSYIMDGTINNIQNYFSTSSDNGTLWKCHSYFEFSGFMMKLMAFVMPGTFKKQTLKFMNDFKAFAEEGKSYVID